MKEFKKGHRKGSYNPITPKGPARASFRATARESRPLEMHQATCVSCKKFCEVPFKPNGKKPVFCRDCFGMQEAQPGRTKPSFGSDRTVVRTSIVPHTPDMKSEIHALNIKIDTLTRMVEALSVARKAAK